MRSKKNKDLSNTLGRKLLKEWMSARDMTINDFILEAKLHYRIAWAWIYGASSPSLKMAVLIEDITEGYVPVRSWLSLLETKPVHKKQKPHQQSHT